MEKELFDDLVSGLEEMVAFEKGTLNKKVEQKVIRPRFRSRLLDNHSARNSVNVSSLRYELSMSQADFARVLGVSANAVSSWEQGLRKPNGAVVKLMILLKNDPKRAIELVG